MSIEFREKRKEGRFDLTTVQGLKRCRLRAISCQPKRMFVRGRMLELPLKPLLQTLLQAGVRVFLFLHPLYVLSFAAIVKI